MSDVADRQSTPASGSGARAFARLDSDAKARGVEAGQVATVIPQRPGTRPQEPATPQTVPVEEPAVVATETVTLNKIGDFLELDFGRLFTWLRRGMLLAIVLAVVGAVAGAFYSTVATPKYTVSTEILINPANLQVVADDLFQAPGQAESALLSAGSKLRVLTSGNVLSRVVDELDLVNDKEFFNPSAGGFSLSSLIGGSAPKVAPDPKLAALGALAKRVSSTADAKSFVATLYVSTETPEKSVRISNAMVSAFQAELATAEAETASRAAEALNNRLEELKTSVKDAEERVEAYKRANNLAASSGELVNNQTLTQLNAQVVEAQSRVIAAQSTYDELVAGGAGAANSDTQASASLTALRAKVADLRAQRDSQAMVYGPRHPTIVRLNTEYTAAKTELDAELARTVVAAKAALAEAKAALAALTKRSDELKSTVFTDSQALVALRELEREAASKTAIYEAFLSRAKQVAEREQIDTTNVTVISSAVPPAGRAWPPSPMILLIGGAIGGFVLGMMLAVVLGIWRDLRRSSHSSV